jgi:hypothetical protein
MAAKRAFGNKGQATWEIAIILLFLLVVIMFDLYMKVEMSIEYSTDFNDLALARESLAKLEHAIDYVTYSGEGAIKDVTIHIPFDTANISCKDSQIVFTVLLYNPDCAQTKGEYVNPDNGVKTVYCYEELTLDTPMPIAECQLCAQEAHQSREGWVDLGNPQQQLKFCCDAGFNMHMRVQKNVTLDGIEILQRRYWDAVGDKKWLLPT